MKMRHLVRASAAVAAIVGLLAFPSQAVAQVEAELAGTVLDETGGALPGVTLTVTHTETGTSRSMTTNENGRFSVRGLRVGLYDIVAELQGFATVRRTGVNLALGQSLTLDLKMAVANISETITVSGEAPLVDTTSSNIGANLDVRQMSTVPLNGRDWLSMTLAAPGARGGGGEPFGVGNVPSFGGGGSSNGRTKVNMDGLQINEASNGTGVGIDFSQEAIREVQVLSNRFSAEYARAAGGVINAVTKSGTNTMNGSFYGFFRNDAFNARSWFTDRVEPFKDTQIGGSIGGPIIRDKLHFFFNWESERRPNTLPIRNGIAVFDTTYKNDFNRDVGVVRLDYQMMPEHRLAVRVAGMNTVKYGDSVGDHISTGVVGPNDGINYLLESSWNVSPNTLNEFRGQYTHFSRPRVGYSTFPFLDFPAADLGARSNAVTIKDEKLLNLKDDYSWFLGSGWGEHTVKMGGEYFIKGSAGCGA